MNGRVLDLFSGEGGAGEGYARAGFEVVGVDLDPQPRYPYAFVQGDAIEVLDHLLAGELVPDGSGGSWALSDFVALHASPPCQNSSSLKSLWRDRDHVELIPPTQERLRASGLPYVIENVERARAKLHEPITLCGSMFGLGAAGRQLRRHRVFECSFFVMRQSCQHRGEPVGVYGHGGGRGARGHSGNKAEAAEALGVDWMTRAGLSQAIPPAYTEHIGGHLAAELARGVSAL